jgi:signal transduction histidine kinase
MPAGRETRPAEVVEFRFDENGDGVGDGDEMIGGVRAVESPADPPRWRVRYVRPDGSDAGGFRWVVAIWYDPTEGSVAPLVRQQVLILSAALLGVMLAACWVVGRRLSRPINALRRMAGELAAGRYRPADRPPDEAGAESAFAAAPREIRDLDRAFLDMAAQVVSKQALEQANAELHEKNRRLDEAVARLTATEEQLRKGQRELEDKARTLEETIRRLNDTQQELLVSNMLASLGVISGEYAHAVNNGLQLPMATLEQLAADLDKLQLPAALREDILSSVDSLKSTAAFVTQFRDFARSDNYAMEPLDLNRVLESVAAGWKPQMRRKQIELETDPGRPPLIQGNDSLLMHVLLNLLLNARDAIRQRRQEAPPGSPERRLTGRIRLATSADEDGSAVLSVTDNGCGIPPEIAPRIFQAMFTTKPKGEGSGLGLSSVLRAVRQHKGQIWFESKPGPGGGTTFFIRFPALKAG